MKVAKLAFPALQSPPLWVSPDTVWAWEPRLEAGLAKLRRLPASQRVRRPDWLRSSPRELRLHWSFVGESQRQLPRKEGEIAAQLPGAPGWP